MKVFRLPTQCKAILFDMDCTLYTNPEYGQLQIDLLIGRLAHLRGKTFDEMNNEITLFKKSWAQEHEGQQISIGNTFTHFGISIRENVQWRKELYQPEKYLGSDKRLRSALEELESQYTLAVVTNNPVSIAIRTLSVLGVEKMIHKIVGLDTCGVSKPSEEMFMHATILCGTIPESCVSVGDRYDIDIALPLELGMGGILVDGVEDVYNLPQMLIH
jgi:phosphoglycolate phosphatase/putative hydrolase of the HAD superfamily